MKLKTKSLIIFVIALFTVLICATSVKAAEVTEETLQQMLDAIPNEMNLDIPESECDKADVEVEKQVKQKWQEKGIDTTNVDVDINASPLYLTKENFYKAIITVTAKEGYNHKYKEISIKYNNTNNYNSADEEAVKKLKLESPRYYEVDIASGDYGVIKYAQKYYQNLISDKTITIIADYGAGGSEGFNGWSWEGGTQIGIFKNGVLYDVRVMGQECTVPVIKVPSSVNEEQFNSYIIDILKRYNKGYLKEVLSITKGATINNGSWSKQVADGYTVKAKFNGDETVDSYIIVRREQPVQTPVTTTDTNTNIKLEATNGVVPDNVVLDVESITKGNAYTNVKKVLPNLSKFVAYDITLKSNGVEIQPNGKLKIKVPIPDGYDTSKLVVYRIDGNNKIKYNVTVETIDGVKYAVFETDHFSTYVLGELSNGNELDETPKTGSANIIYYILPITLMSAVGIVALKRKETK